MKKILIFSLAMLCLKFAFAQGTFSDLNSEKTVLSVLDIPENTGIITFPIHGTVFQRKTSGDQTYNLAIAGSSYTNTGYFYRVSKRNNDGTYTSVNEWAGAVYQGTTSSVQCGAGYCFLKQDFLYLSEGWYRLDLLKNLSQAPVSSVAFGVGDVYFVAGQSNASGYNHSQQGAALPSRPDFTNTDDLTIPHLIGGNSTYQNVMARVFNKDGKFEYFDVINTNRNSTKPVNGIYDGLPFASKFGLLKNGTDKVNNPGYIYPNGMASWYWAPLAHKIVENKKTPVLLFNAAFPGSSIKGGWHPTETGANERKKFLQTLGLYGNILGAKSVLWHQGEDDAANQSTYGNSPFPLGNYSTFLAGANGLISQSRGVLDKTNNLSWYVSKVSYFTAPLNTTNATGLTGLTAGSDLNPPGTHPFAKKIFTHSGIIDQQTISLSLSPNVFPGLITSDNLQENYRDDKFKLHFSGDKIVGGLQSLQKVADDWYDQLYAAGAYTAAPGISPTRVVKLTSAAYNGTSYTLSVDPVGNSNYYFVRNDKGIYSTATYENNNINSPTFTFLNVQDGDILTCYVKDNADRFHVTQPVMVYGGQPPVILTVENSEIQMNSNGDTKYNSVFFQNINWEIVSFPSWLTSVQYLSGDNNSLKIVAPSNPNTIQREGTVIIRKIGGGTQASFIVRQVGTGSPPTSGPVDLTTLTPSSSTGWFRVDKSTNNNTMLISGNPYYKGFGVHAQHSMTFNLNGQYSTFSGKVGRDDEEDPSTGLNNVGQMQFKIRLNGAATPYWTSIVHNSITNAECFNIPVAGVQTLELITDKFTDNDYFDHGDWVDLVLNSPLNPVSCSTCKNNNPTNVAANPVSLPSTGGSSTLSATCPANTTATWSTGAQGGSISVSQTTSLTYWVTCNGNNCIESNQVNVSVNVAPASGCSGVDNNLVAGTWTTSNGTQFALVVRDFHNNKWLTQRIGTNPDKFLVRGHNMLSRPDVSGVNSTVLNKASCFIYSYSDYGGIVPPTSSVFATPTDYALTYECTTPPCNASNGTPIYTFGGAPPPPPPPSGCAGTFYLNNSWTYAGGVTTSPVIGGNTVGGNMIMGGVNYTSQYPGKGLGMHANSEVVYDLGANHGFTTFKATVGKDDGNFCSASWAGQEKITFKLVNNATGVDISSVTVGNPNTGISQTANFEVPIAGVRYIKLVAGDGGDGNYCDWANWANARVVCSPSSRTGSKEEEQEDIEESVLVLPNPNNGNFESLIMLNSASSLDLSLVNNLGQVFETKKVNGVVGANKVHFKVSNLAKGVYTLRVQTDTKVLTSKVVIE
jgi:NPCBM/NEW2 domain/Secretion system C-terminal sorting domain